MVEHTRFGSQDPDFDGYSQSRSLQRRYAFGRTAKTDDDGSVPLFLSDPDGEPDPSEYDYPDFEAPRPRMSISLKILMAVVGAAGVAMIFAMATSDATRDIINSAKASFISASPTPAEAAQSDVAQQANVSGLAAGDTQKDPARWAAPGTIVPNAAASSAPQTAGITRGPVIAMAPTREDTSSAYQSPAQSRAPAVPAPPAASSAPPVIAAPVAPAPAVAAPPTARMIDAGELAVLMKRAKEMLNAGDIPAARLLLRRAADGGRDPTAALLLAQTYDPEVLGTQDARNIIPEPETARAWYQKAAQLGSSDAQRRLAQMQ